MTEVKGKSHGRLSVQVSLKPRDLMAEPPRVKNAWRARIVTLFPEAFPGTLGLSITGKALDQGLWALDAIPLRQFGEGKHRNVDDTPAGGGAGMVLRADVVARALGEACHGLPMDREKCPIIYLSPRGKRFDQAMARKWAAAEGVVMICGRFEGVDQRVLDRYQIEEVSLGDFVMTGGEIAAQAMIDATVRLLPGVLGNAASADEESFSDGLLEHPQYTRPQTWEGLEIPAVLNSGNHGEVEKWRRVQSLEITKARRPELHEAWMARQPAPKKKR
ncbi:tRNA (guanosine(37)-N1)-methyltransferase TrmD [Falsigemmobacter intermedius]|uniref:tRNA (guanosine(37)-N1)-methyltransferase TrmD n=1 Tax=Falsigemmobacter intermedius TaxID=1553448 RepID=UPI003EFE41A1